MATLTEQYLNGNIKDGTEWYIKNRKGEIFTMYLYNDTCHYHSFKTKKLEVLDEVPDHTDWQGMKRNCETFMKKSISLLEENTKLKELLKKANKFLKDYGFTFDGKDCAEAFKVHTKINQVLVNNKIQANTVACNKIQEHK